MTLTCSIQPGVSIGTSSLTQRSQNRRLHVFRSRHPIPLNRNYVWVVHRGIVQLSTLHMNGDETLLGLVCPGAAFSPDWSVVTPFQAEALTEVILVSYSKQEIEQSPALALELLHCMEQRLKQAEALLAMAGCRRIEDRLRQLLLLLKMEVGYPVSSGTRLSVKLTHQHMASAIGTTRVTVTRLLGRLKEEGWLELDDKRHIVIPPTSGIALY